MLGAGPYTSVVRSYTVPYVFTVKLRDERGDYQVVENAEDWVNFEVYFFWSSVAVTGN